MSKQDIDPYRFIESINKVAEGLNNIARQIKFANPPEKIKQLEKTMAEEAPPTITQREVAEIQHSRGLLQRIVENQFDVIKQLLIALNEGEPNPFYHESAVKMMEFEARANRAEKELEHTKKQMGYWQERCNRAETRLEHLEKGNEEEE